MKSWSHRVNMVIFGICVVDTWLAWKQATNARFSQSEFYTDLAEELINNNYDSVSTATRGCRRRSNNSASSLELYDAISVHPRGGVSAHLMPTKKRRKDKTGRKSSFAFQGRCAEYKKKTKYTCSLCSDSNMGERRIFSAIPKRAEIALQST